MFPQETWRLVETWDGDPHWNMAVDEAILQTHVAGLTPPTLRFYTWKPYALSLGYAQKVSTAADVEALARHGVVLVRRPTGGRAVFHADELTYSVVLSVGHRLAPESVLASYRLLSAGLLAGYRILGIPAELAPETNRDARTKDSGSSPDCFDTPSPYELVVEGKKIAGSAQMRSEGGVLQHGSLPITSDVDLLFALFPFADEGERLKAKEYHRRRATTMAEVLGYRPDFEEVVRAFRQGFEEALGIRLEPDELHPAEEVLADKLAEEKYRQEGWTFRRR
ncbi:lipoate--protein ligase family protein [Brockia lithotrophica]|uniref:Lipoate-protein ligase A n=1 Tax=Brockia lithotrophica TaxID=933949 RepID=A0A660L483_9BACL|nr:biotin/lipoate A/B protein ligase family protein [Brockia lithotrophica]RKQ88757.1 lipoate-protein ligase A [Brockia lithotrophica]